MALINKLSAIGDAIRAKTGGTQKLTLDQMPDAINSITSGSPGGGTSNLGLYSGKIYRSSSSQLYLNQISFTGCGIDFKTQNYALFFSVKQTGTSYENHFIYRYENGNFYKLTQGFYPGADCEINCFNNNTASNPHSTCMLTGISVYNDKFLFTFDFNLDDPDEYELDKEFVPFVVIKE